MNPVFEISNWLVVPFWLLMIFAPRCTVTHRLMTTGIPVLLPAILYAVLVVPRIPGLWGELFNPALPNIATLLGTPEGAAIAWAHFLAFDLFVGRWIYQDSRLRDFSPWIMGPVLLLTLMFGPLGYLVYMAMVRWASWFRNSDPAQGNPSGAIDARPHNALWSAVQLLRKGTPALFWVGVGGLILLAPAVLGMLLDTRMVTGAPVWLKPAKFLASSSIYALTLAWLLTFVEGRVRLVRWVGNGTAVALAVELVIILVQAGRGTTSHFNTTTALDAVLWSVMGAFILTLWLLGFAAAIGLSRQPSTDPVFATSLRLGMAVTLLGMGEGMLMAVPGAHSVGIADGGPGLPIVNWSTVGGDLRVPHFVGLHALQVLPAVGFLLSSRRQKLFAREQCLALVRIAAGSYTALLLLLTWQALRGQSVIHPDLLTVTAFGCLVLATSLFVWMVVHAAKRPVGLQRLSP